MSANRDVRNFGVSGDAQVTLRRSGGSVLDFKLPFTMRARHQKSPARHWNTKPAFAIFTDNDHLLRGVLTVLAPKMMNIDIGFPTARRLLKLGPP